MTRTSNLLFYFARHVLKVGSGLRMGIVALFCLIGLEAFAQPSPCFNIIGSDAVCAPGKIIVNSCVTGTNVFYQPDSSNPRFVINGRPGIDTIRYSTPGKYRLGQGILVGGVNRYVYKTVYILQPRTPVPSAVACDNYLVNISIPKIEGERFIIIYGDGSRDTTSNTPSTVATASHKYTATASNPATIQVKSLYDCGRDTTIKVGLYGPFLGPDSVQIQRQNTTQLAIKLNGRFAYQTKVELLSGTTYLPLPINQVDSNNIIVNNLTSSNTSCFRLTCTDRCNTPVATIPFCLTENGATANNEFNRYVLQLGQQPALVTSAPATLAVYRNGKPYWSRTGTVATFQVLNSWRDSNIVCNQRYCYDAVLRFRQPYATNQTSLLIIRTVSVCATGISRRTPSTLESLTPTKLDLATQLFWKAPTDYKVRYYVVRKYINGKTDPEFEERTTKTTFIDPVFQPNNQNFQYTIQFMDSCNNLSKESARVNPCLLRGTQIAERVIDINWVRLETWPKKPKAYVLQTLNKDNKVIEETDLGPEVFTYSHRGRYERAQRLIYRIKVVPDTNLVDTSFSNILVFNQEASIIMPNAFSPNDDKINDLYTVKLNYINNFRMRIVNRWGNLVYDSFDPEQGWDGLVNGNRAPIDVYVATVTGEDELGKPITQTQMVTLIR